MRIEIIITNFKSQNKFIFRNVWFKLKNNIKATRQGKR